jgi:tRNA uridine 5-carboxymethylaminomethyl modification enzyme
LNLTPNEAAKHGLALNRDGVRRSAYELLAYPDVSAARLEAIWPELAEFDSVTKESLETEARYAVYMDRQRIEAQQIRREEETAIPAGMDFSLAPGLSNELKQKLRVRQPRSIAEAQRIDGMTPAALAIVISCIRGVEAGLRRGAA